MRLKLALGTTVLLLATTVAYFPVRAQFRISGARIVRPLVQARVTVANADRIVRVDPVLVQNPAIL